MVRAALGQSASTDAYGGTASSEPLITKRMAIEKIASIFGIENVDAALKQIEDEKAENEQKAQDKLLAQQKLMAQSATPDDKGAGAAKSDDEKPTQIAA